MRKKLWFMLTGMAMLFGFLQMQAQVPYLPKKAVLEQTLASGDFSTFAPKGNYTLEVTMKAGQSIDARNPHSIGFVYEAKEDGLHRFVVKGTSIYVFNNGKYQETITEHSSVFPDIFSGTDDATAQTGIYDAKNLFKNPGFETCTYYDGYNLDVNPNATDVRGKPANWEVPVANNVFNNSRNNQILVNPGYAALKPIAEGKWSFMVHGAVIPLWQKLESLKPATWYKVTYRQMAHKDNSIATAYASYIAKDPEGSIDTNNTIAIHKYYSAPMGLGNKVDVTYYFQTPETLSEDLYFVIKRTGSMDCINHYDRMTLVEATPLTGGLTISDASEIKYEEEAYVPAIDGLAYDMTGYVKNPNMDAATDWISTTKSYSNKLASNQAGDFIGAFWENWNGTNFTGKLYQTITGLPNGKYVLKAATFAEQNGSGFYLYGNEGKTLANTKTPTFHSVEFVVLSGTAEIGIVAEEATNHWIGLDNVTLSYLGYDDGYLTAALEKLNTLMGTATELKSEKTGPADLSALENALEKAITAQTMGTADAIDEALTTLEATIEKAKTTIAVYTSLEEAITVANTNKENYSEFPGYGEFETAITVAQEIYNANATDSIATATAIVTLKKAENKCRFTQPTPFNASFLIQNPDFASGFNGWKHDNIPATSNEYKVITANGKTCWNSWSNNFTSMDVFQLLENVPAGIYSLSCYTATDGKPNDQHAYIKTSTGTVVSPAATLLTGSNSGKPFATPWESLSTKEIIVGEDGKVRIGMASTSGGGTSGWFCVTGFELTCLSLTSAPVAPVAPTVPEFEVPAETKPVVTGGYLIYHPDSKKFLANNNGGGNAALNDYGFIKDNDAYTWTVTTSGDNADNITLQQLSSGKYANTSRDSWNSWDMVFDSQRTEKWLLKNLPEGGYTISSLVRSKDKMVGVDGLSGNPLSVFIDKGTDKHPTFQFIDKEVFFALPEIVAYSAELEAYNQKMAAYNAELAIYEAKKVLETTIEEANQYLLTDPDRYNDAVKATFNEAIESSKTVYMDKEATLEGIQESTSLLKTAQLTYRLSINASEEAPADFTFMIVNPTFTGSPNGWISDTDAANKQLKTEDPNREIAFNGTFLENWKPSNMDNGKIHQTINGFPKGKYLFKMAAFNAGAAIENGAFIFANESESPVNNLDPAYHTVEVNVMEGTLEIGLRIVANSTNWVGIDNASLTYLGYGVGVLVENLNTQITLAEALTGTMQTSLAEALAKAIEDGKAVANESSTEEELEAAIALLKETIEKANTSIAAYEKLTTAISKAEISSVAGETEVTTAIQAAKEVHATHSVDEIGVNEAIKALNLAVNATIISKSENGDATALIINPTITQSGTSETTRPTGWEDSMNSGTNGNFTKAKAEAGSSIDTYLEAWGADPAKITFDYNQTIPSTPNGLYEVAAATFTEDNTGNAVLYANEVTTPMMKGWDTFNDSTANTKLIVQVINDTLKIGIKTIGTLSASWSGADFFKLTYLGTDALDALEKLITTANNLLTGDDTKLLFTKAAAQKLSDAISNAQTVDKTSPEAVNTQINAMRSAIAAAQTTLELTAQMVPLFVEAKELLESTDPYPAEARVALKAVLDRDLALYEAATTTDQNIIDGIAELKKAIEDYKATKSPDAIGEVNTDGIKIYVEGSKITVEGTTDYTIYTESGILVSANAELIPGIYIVKVADQTVKIQVK